VASDVDHSDTCGCCFLLGGVVMGLTLLLLHVGGNLRSGFAGPNNGGATAAFSSWMPCLGCEGRGLWRLCLCGSLLWGLMVRSCSCWLLL
jgi:hypothetical protein